MAVKLPLVTNDECNAKARGGSGDTTIMAPGPYLHHIRIVGSVYKFNTGGGAAIYEKTG